MNFMRWLIPAPKVEPEKPSPLIDLQRRGFIFGAAATLVLPPVRTFHFLPKQELIFPELITVPQGKLFDLPNREALEMMMKLLDDHYKMSDIPQWVVCDKDWYDTVVQAQARGAKFETPMHLPQRMQRRLHRGVGGVEEVRGEGGLLRRRLSGTAT